MRVIVGELGTAGKSISAPVTSASEVETHLRWRESKHSFVLEFWHEVRKQWIEVPCISRCELAESEQSTSP